MLDQNHPRQKNHAALDHWNHYKMDSDDELPELPLPQPMMYS